MLAGQPTLQRNHTYLKCHTATPRASSRIRRTIADTAPVLAGSVPKEPDVTITLPATGPTRLPSPEGAIPISFLSSSE